MSNPQEKRLLEELGVEGMTTLKIILNYRRTGTGIYSFGSEKCPGGYGNVTVRSQYSVEPKELRVNQSSGATALQGFGRQSGRRRSAKLVPTFADRGVSRGQRNGSPRPSISVLPNLDRYLLYSSSSSIDLTRLTRLSVPRSRPTATQKIW